MSLLYAALGDSMSIDDYAGGPGRGAAALLHRNRDDDFPDRAGQDLASRGYRLQLLARDGAVANDVLHLQLEQLDRATDLVTLTLGGNDLLAAYGDAHAAQLAVDRVGAVTHVLLGRVRSRVRGTVLVSTVYDPSDGLGHWLRDDLAPWPEGPVLVTALNAALAQAAERHGAILADVHGRFLGHGVAAGDPGQPDPRPQDRALWYCGQVEPNAWGAGAIRDVWWDALTGAGVL